MKAPAGGRVADGVRPDLLHDDGELGQLVFAEAERRREALHGPPRRPDLRLVRDGL